MSKLEEEAKKGDEQIKRNLEIVKKIRKLRAKAGYDTAYIKRLRRKIK